MLSIDRLDALALTQKGREGAVAITIKARMAELEVELNVELDFEDADHFSDELVEAVNEAQRRLARAEAADA